jgi:hypothetical protein
MKENGAKNQAAIIASSVEIIMAAAAISANGIIISVTMA